MVLVSLDDLWLERDPPNVPGVAAEYPSFRLRSERSVQQILSDPAVLSLLRRLGTLRRKGVSSGPSVAGTGLSAR
jgi:4-alpha-glucanotransferase